MVEQHKQRMVRLCDNLAAYATILKNSGVVAEEAVVLVKTLPIKELPGAAASELAMRSILDAYYSD